MNYEKTLEKHVKRIGEMQKSGFSLVYSGNQEPFFVMLNGGKSTFCSAQILKVFDNDAYDFNYKIKYTLVSPYLENEKIVYDSLDEVMSVMQSMPELPVKDLAISDLPIISDYETSQIRSDKDIYEYFGVDRLYFNTQKRLAEEIPELERVDLDIDGMESKYEAYEKENLAQKNYSKKLERLGEMPKEVRTLFGEEHEQGTLESKMPEYKKFVLKMHS